jgi:hypothetical protein
MKMKYGIFILIVAFIAIVNVYFPLTPPGTSMPTGWTNFLGLRLYADGDTATADSINQNWTDIDDGVELNNDRLDTVMGVIDEAWWDEDMINGTIAPSKISPNVGDNSLLHTLSATTSWFYPTGDIGLTSGVFSISGGVIVNADISNTAGIDENKFKTSSDAKMFVADATGTWQDVSLSGDVTIDNAGVTDLTDHLTIDSSLTVTSIFRIAPQNVTDIPTNTDSLKALSSMINYYNSSNDTLDTIIFGAVDGMSLSATGQILYLTNDGPGTLLIEHGTGNIYWSKGTDYSMGADELVIFVNVAPDADTYTWMGITAN